MCNKLGNACNEYFVESDRNDVNHKCDWLLNKLNSLYFPSCPLKCKTIYVKNLQKPWINAQLRRMANYKHIGCLNNKNLAISILMCIIVIRTIYVIKLKMQRKHIFVKSLEKKTYFCKKTWKTINSILSNKRKIESHIVLTGDNDEDICDSLEIANKFCNFFSTIADRLDEAIPTTDTDPMDYLPDAA